MVGENRSKDAAVLGLTMKKFNESTPYEVENVFAGDTGFRDLLRDLAGAAEAERLSSVLVRWQKKIPRWNALAIEAARPEKLPRVEKYDNVGNFLEKIVLSMETKTIRREVVEEGIFNNRSEVEKFSKIYLLAQIGESGVTCPLACTDGLIRVIQKKGSDELKNRCLKLLQSVEYPLSGAQFITETSGGSDVGAIEGFAKPAPDGSWAVTAEKWYCSAADEFFLVAARPCGSAQGTRGLAIFFVPRVLKAGGCEVTNNYSIRRLKDKTGTQSLPTAEIDFRESKGWPIGPLEEGFYNLMNYVINISRLHNAANSLGLERRAYGEARNYAEQRTAFGSEIINYPLVQESLVSILCDLTAKRQIYFSLLGSIDEKGYMPEDREERLTQRFFINMLKYRTASTLTQMVKEAILVFGANGIINDFSILPRLVKDSLIVETWEGTHNTLCLQILRDAMRFDFSGMMQAKIGEILSAWPEGVLQKSRKIFCSAVDGGKKLLVPENFSNPSWSQTHARRLVDHFACILEIGGLVRDGVLHGRQNVLLMASFLAHSRMLDSYSGFSNPVVNRLEVLGLDLIREKPVKVDLADY